MGNYYLENGYKEASTNALGKALGFLSYESSDKIPMAFSMKFNGGDTKLQQIALTFAADTDMFSTIRDNINFLLGKSDFREAYTEKTATYVATYGEALIWSGYGYRFEIHGIGNSNGAPMATIADIESGISPFILTISANTVPQGSTDANAYPQQQATPTITPKPTPKPTPMKLSVVVNSLSLGSNSIGTPRMFLSFKNNETSASVDRVDFRIECFDAYGNTIRQYGHQQYINGFFDSVTIKAGKASSKDYYWDLYGLEGTKSIRIAITKYHTTAGKTVEVPDELLSWKTY